MGQGPIDIFIPLPRSDDTQIVSLEQLKTSHPGELDKEAVYGNRFWHLHLDDYDGRPVTFEGWWQVERFSRVLPAIASDGASALAKIAPVPEVYLKGWERVPVGEQDALVAPILAEIRKSRNPKSPGEWSRAIYDYVIDNMTYKKVGTGWGQGDSHWACTEKYGNCTDFHALYMSLARSVGIPARFEMGLPVEPQLSEGDIAGYHCWLSIYLPLRGWMGIDGSEAAKHPELKEAYYGAQPADRVLFTYGRNMRLGEGHHGAAINYFIYPHTEIAGEKVESPRPAWSFTRTTKE